VLLNSSFFDVPSPVSTRQIDGPTVRVRFRTMKYSRVMFRKERDGTVIAFEKCGCEAEADTFRPCRMHQGNAHQAARLKAEARYHSIQKCVSNSKTLSWQVG
jgi:hypothetical protein